MNVIAYTELYLKQHLMIENLLLRLELNDKEVSLYRTLITELIQELPEEKREKYAEKAIEIIRSCGVFYHV